jgi:type IV pilus biogenesis protein CpaD/CtpE
MTTEPQKTPLEKLLERRAKGVSFYTAQDIDTALAVPAQIREALSDAAQELDENLDWLISNNRITKNERERISKKIARYRKFAEQANELA